MSGMTTTKKAAYAAIGFPLHVVSDLQVRIADIRGQLTAWRDRLPEGAQHTIKEWIDEGEQIITSLGAKVKEQRDLLDDSLHEGADTLGRERPQ